MSSELHHVTHQRIVESLVQKLRRRQVVGSHASSYETVLVLRQVVSKARFASFEQLVVIIRSVGRRLIEAQPKEHAVGNIVRKVLHNIREEYHAATNVPTASSPGTFSIAKFVLLGQPRKQSNLPRVSEEKGFLKENNPDDPDSFAKSLKPVLMEAIQDVLDELETVYDNVSKNARDHIHSDEIILTIGKSRTVEAFLKSAARHRNYTVIVAETAPSDSGCEFADLLSTAGISTFLVPDSSIYALLSRVNKLILSAHSVLANGGMFSISGSLMAATAARVHRVPVVVCTGQFKITPKWTLYHEYGGLDFGDPSAVLAWDEGELVDAVNVLNPYFDYVGPELVDAYVTNDGTHPPSSIYRLIKESYDDEDHDL